MRWTRRGSASSRRAPGAGLLCGSAIAKHLQSPAGVAGRPPVTRRARPSARAPRTRPRAPPGQPGGLADGALGAQAAGGARRRSGERGAGSCARTLTLFLYPTPCRAGIACAGDRGHHGQLAVDGRRGRVCGLDRQCQSDTRRLLHAPGHAALARRRSPRPPAWPPTVAYKLGGRHKLKTVMTH